MYSVIWSSLASDAQAGPAWIALLFFHYVPSSLVEGPYKEEKNWGGGPYFTAWYCSHEAPSQSLCSDTSRAAPQPPYKPV